MLENSWLTAGLCAVLGALFAVFGWISTRNAALCAIPSLLPPQADAAHGLGFALPAWQGKAARFKTPGGLLL